MKFWFGTPGWGWRLWGVSNGDKWFIGLSIKQPGGSDNDRRPRATQHQEPTT